MYLFSFLQVSSKQGGTDSESKVPINSRMVRARKIVHFDFDLKPGLREQDTVEKKSRPLY